MSDKIRIGLAGCSRGTGIVKMFNAHPEAEVTALCDPDESATAKLAEPFGLAADRVFADYGEFLAGAPMDAVIVATPIEMHADQSVQALEAGKHVLCEQTMAYSAEDCGRVIDAVKKTGLVYMMAENYCYFHFIRQMREIVSAGRIGEIYYAEGEYIHEIINLLQDPETGEFFWRHQRPPIWYCAHSLGPILLMMQDRIVEACGLTSGFKRKPEFKDHLGYLDFEIGLFKTEKGSVVKLLRSQTAARPHMHWYCLYGTKGHLESGRFDKLKLDGMHYFEGMDYKDPAQLVECPNSDPDLPKEASEGGHGTSEYFMIRDFLEAVQKNERPIIDAIRASEWTIPGLVAHESAMQGGKWMKVPTFDW